MWSGLCDFFVGVSSGIAATFLAQYLSRRHYLKRKHGIPNFEYAQCSTFSSQDNKNFQIVSIGDNYIESKIFFENHQSGAYAGLVFKPSNSYFTPYIKKKKRLNFEFSADKDISLTLEFKSNHNNIQNAVFAECKIDSRQKSYSIPLKGLCNDLSKWEDVTQIVFLARYDGHELDCKFKISDFKISR